MADVTCKKLLLLFVAFLLVVPLFVRSLETGHSVSVRRLLKHSQPPKTTMATATAAATATATHAEFHAAAHEVPSGPNPESNSKKWWGSVIENKVMETWHGQNMTSPFWCHDSQIIGQ